MLLYGVAIVASSFQPSNESYEVIALNSNLKTFSKVMRKISLVRKQFISRTLFGLSKNGKKHVVLAIVCAVERCMNSNVFVNAASSNFNSNISFEIRYVDSSPKQIEKIVDCFRPIVS